MRMTCKLPDHAEVVEALLEGFVRACQVCIEAGLAPSDPADTGVKYKLESPGKEDWVLPQDVVRKGYGDCEDLAGWRAAGLRSRGEDEGARVVVRQTGKSRLHAVVERSDGSIDDPSRELRTRERELAGTRTEVRSPTRTEVRSPTRTATRAHTSGNVTVTGGAGAGATSVRIYGTPDTLGADRPHTPRPVPPRPVPARDGRPLWGPNGAQITDGSVRYTKGKGGQIIATPTRERTASQTVDRDRSRGITAQMEAENIAVPIPGTGYPPYGGPAVQYPSGMYPYQYQGYGYDTPSDSPYQGYDEVQYPGGAVFQNPYGYGYDDDPYSAYSAYNGYEDNSAYGISPYASYDPLLYGGTDPTLQSPEDWGDHAAPRRGERRVRVRSTP